MKPSKPIADVVRHRDVALDLLYVRKMSHLPVGLPVLGRFVKLERQIPSLRDLILGGANLGNDEMLIQGLLRDVDCIAVITEDFNAADACVKQTYLHQRCHQQGS